MSFSSFVSNSASVGKIADNNVTKPVGSGSVQATPTVPPAVFSASADTGTSPTPKYTKTDSENLIFYLAACNFTSGSLAGVFWTDSGGVNRYQLDCTISVASLASGYYPVTITGVASPPGALSNGAMAQSNFASITAGTTKVTLSIATLATTDTPSNPDLNDYTIPIASLEQLLMTNTQLGAMELFATPVGAISDAGSTDGAWVESTKTLTPSNAPGWVVNALVGLAVTVNGTPVGTVVSNTTTALVTSITGSVGNGTYTWSIASPNSVLYWNYSTDGQFFNWPNQANASAPYAGNITKMRFYNNSLSNNVFGVGANIA